MSCDLCVVIPTFNERDNIAEIVKRLSGVLSGIKWEIIFVDDDSPDGTAAVVRSISENYPNVRCLHRIHRRGLASACIDGFQAASAPVIAVMDADMQHDETLLPEMLDAVRYGADLVIGSRYVSGGSTGELPSVRVRISRAATWLSRLVMKHEITDPMSGFFMMKREVYEQTSKKLAGRGFKILLDILMSANRNIVIRELPYSMRKREAGESKLGASVIWDYFTLIIYKLSGSLLPYRFLSFVAVGLTGLIIHLFALWLGFRIIEMEFLVSQLIATLVAMTSNFVLNNHLTFGELKLSGKAFVTGLLTFYLACSLGAVINVSVAGLLFEVSFPWWFAGLLGAVAGAVWNYALTSTFAWDRNIYRKNR